MLADNLQAAERVHAEAIADVQKLSAQAEATQATVERLSEEIASLDPAASDKQFLTLAAARDAARARGEALARSIEQAKAKAVQAAEAMTAARVPIAQQRLAATCEAVADESRELHELVMACEQSIRDGRAAIVAAVDEAAEASRELSRLGVNAIGADSVWRSLRCDDGTGRALEYAAKVLQKLATKASEEENRRLEAEKQAREMAERLNEDGTIAPLKNPVHAKKASGLHVVMDTHARTDGRGVEVLS